LINNQELRIQLRPGEIEDIEINLFIPKDIKENYQVVMFRLKEKDDGFIGQPLIAFIKVIKDIQPLSASQYIRKSSIENF
jgi:hypothetical protein